MKIGNLLEGGSMARLVIEILTAAVTFVLGVSVTNLSMSAHQTQPVTLVEEESNAPIFDGTVLQIGPRVPASGRMAFYRLAKYQVDRVVYGTYSGREIVVDYLSLTTRELDGIKKGDRVCIAVRPSKKVLLRMDVPGIREENEYFESFYLGEVDPTPSQCP